MSKTQIRNQKLTALLPRPSTGPKMFWIGPKLFVPNQRMILIFVAAQNAVCNTHFFKFWIDEKNCAQNEWKHEFWNIAKYVEISKIVKIGQRLFHIGISYIHTFLDKNWLN